MPAPPDKRTVELVKVRYAQCGNISKVAREFNISTRTVGRYIKYDDDPEFAEEIAEIRHLNQTKFITDAWRIMHKGLDIADARLEDPKTSAKDATTIVAILADKVHMMETYGAHKVEESSKTTIILEVVDGSTSKTLAIPGEISQLPGEIQGDDRGEGFGENILALPGGNQDQS
jgi:hypothetical protein